MDGAPSDDELLDLLMDMKHDLGKYIVMPVAMLPTDASPTQLREALRRALLQTRGEGEAAHSAQVLWRGFVQEGGEPLRALAGFAQLQAAVERATAWESALGADTPIDRDALLSDLRAVGEAMGALIATCDGAR